MKKQKKRQNLETKRESKIIYWAPRIMAILYIIIIGIFVFVDTLFSSSFFINLIPEIILLIILILAWKKELIGGIFFMIMGVVFFIIFDAYASIEAFTGISLLLLVIGMLFILSYLKK